MSTFNQQAYESNKLAPPSKMIMRNDDSNHVRDSYSFENQSQLKQSMESHSIHFTRQNESELGQSTRGGLRPEFIKPQGMGRKT